VEGVYNVGLDSEAEKSVFPRIFPSSAQGLLNFMKNQALGIPHGNHGMLSRYGIDGISIVATNQPAQQVYDITKFGRIIEGTMRCLNSIAEHLHQSFYYYLLPSPFKYISIGIYMISLGLIMAGTFAYYAYIVLNSNKSDLIYSLTMVSVAHFGSSIIFAFPFTYNRIFGISTSPLPQMMIWTLVSCTILFGIFTAFKKINHQLLTPGPKIMLLKSSTTENDTSTTSSKLEVLKAFSISFLILFLAVFSLVNFSFVIFSSILVVPFCTILGHPQPKNKILAKLQTFVLILLNPVAVMLVGAVMKGSLFSLVWDNLKYATLFFPFLGLVYLPLNLIAIQISLTKS